MVRGTILQIVILVFLSWEIVSPSLAHIAYYNLFVVSGADGNIHQLTVSPNGQILDPNIQYVVGGGVGGVAVSTDYRFLLASAGGPLAYCFQILPNGNLLEVSSDSGGGASLLITPNDELVIAVGGASGGSPTLIYSLTSTGVLGNGTVNPILINPNIDPFGRGVLARSSITTFSVYTINYNVKSLTLTTTYFTGGNGNYFEFSFTPNGKLGFVSALGSVSPSGGTLWVLDIDSAFNVTTTSHIFTVSGSSVVPGPPAISPDGKYLWLPMGFINLFSIDTLGNVTDTGQKYNVPDGAVFLQRNTPDGRFAIVRYEDFSINDAGDFATAIIKGDGSLTWTGYTFSFNYGEYVTDFVVVPVYVTGVEDKYWELLDDK